jgi:hypothetical protein
VGGRGGGGGVQWLRATLSWSAVRGGGGGEGDGEGEDEDEDEERALEEVVEAVVPPVKDGATGEGMLV